MAEDDAPWLFVYRAPYAFDPIDWAEQQLTLMFGTHRDVLADREVDPSAWPILGRDVSDGAFARRVLGQLLDYGWQPPVVPAVPGAESVVP